MQKPDQEKTAGNGNPTSTPAGMSDRRKREPDGWARLFRHLTLVIYPALILYVLLFAALANAAQRAALAKPFGQTLAERAGSAGLRAFLPIMFSGVLIGALGVALSHRRSRRRFDYNYQTQVGLLILSAGGLLIYFLLRDCLI